MQLEHFVDGSKSGSESDRCALGAPIGDRIGAAVGGRSDRYRMGRIWDTLPGNFPVYPGSTPGEETARVRRRPTWSLMALTPRAS